MNLLKEQGQLLLKIARQQITRLLHKDKKLDLQVYLTEKWLLEPGAVFVTLTINCELRGCIGSMEAYRPLLTDLLEHAANSAFKDTRFYPLTLEELDHINIEISVLTPRQEVTYQSATELKHKVRPLIDGVYLSSGRHAATFLPQVWEHLPDFHSFFAHLCQKAGLQPDSLIKEHPKVEIYQVQKFSEAEYD